MASVSLRRVSKVYSGAHTALSDVTVDVASGEFFVLTGPAGCGKSTVLRLICGLEEPTGGEIFIDGKPVTGMSVKERDVALVSGGMPLIKSKAALYDNLAYGLKIRKTEPSEIKRRVESAAETFGLKSALTEKACELPAHLRAISALARVLARRPRVVLLDDPLLGLVGKERVEVMLAIEKLRARLDAAFICATPDQADAMTLATRAAVMKNGVIRGADTPQGLYENPDDMFVAAFLGCPQMSFIPARLVEAGGLLTAKIGEESVVLPISRTRRIINIPADGEVVIGVRAEDFHSEQLFIETSPDTVVSAKVRFIERLGGESVLYMSVSGKSESVVARVDSRLRVQTGDTVKLAIDSNRVHFFDSKSGVNLSALPKYNLIDCKLLAGDGGTLAAYFGKTKIELPYSTVSRLLDRSAVNGEAVIGVPPDALSFKPMNGGVEIGGEVDFTVNNRSFISVYLRVAGCARCIVVKAPCDCNASAGEKTSVYLNAERAVLMKNDAARITASRPITDNVTKALVEVRNGVAKARFCKNTLVMPAEGKWKSGHYPLFRIPPSAVRINGEKPQIKALVQDVDYTGEYTVLYLKADGFEPYFTAAVKGKYECEIGSKIKLSVDASAVQPVGVKSLSEFLTDKAKEAPPYVFVEEE